jgi:uncharacterized membrane protein
MMAILSGDVAKTAMTVVIVLARTAPTQTVRDITHPTQRTHPPYLRPNRSASMTLAVLYLATFATFLVLDAIMLSLVMKPLFTAHIGPLMAEPIRLAPAALFYAGYIAGLLYLVSVPALRDGAPVILPAAVIGAMAYGTYEFTSYAILRDWHWTMVVTDTLWGAVLTAAAAWIGVAVVRALPLEV